jgi:hypothetical protein
MVASGKSCDGPEPKCGSKMLWGGVCGGCGLVGVILLIVAFTSVPPLPARPRGVTETRRLENAPRNGP